ncbi:MAG: hypothetical protein MR387_09945 [Phocaeicola plebeius]|nr:hypothetical protein [Phocaeicola plebeius]
MDKRKALRLLSILSGLIGLSAVAIGVIALDKKEYVIAIGMMFVAVWQVYNLITWKRYR